MRASHKLAIIFSFAIVSMFFVWGSLPFRIVFKEFPSALADHNPPMMVKDINPGSGNAGSMQFIEYHNQIFFLGSNAMSGAELWISDGTESGTHLFKDINPGSSGSTPNSFAILNDKLYFMANDGDGYEIWSSDGTADGTVMVEDVFTYDEPSGLGRPYGPMVVTDGKLYFGGSETTHGAELWSSEGTVGTTAMVADIQSGAASSTPSNFIVFVGAVDVGGYMYFSADDGTNGRELWVSDGTEVGTYMVKDINPGAADSDPFGDDAFATFKGKLFFAATTADNGRELWRTDGTEGNTGLFDDINPDSESSNPKYLEVYNNRLYFSASNGGAGKGGGDGSGQELWVTDGIADSDIAPDTLAIIRGAALSEDINPGVGDSNPQFLSAGYNNLLYFGATDGVNGVELWQTDGLAGATVMTYDINPGSGDSSPQLFTNYKNLLFFYATNGVNGYELWSYNASRGSGTTSYARITISATINGGRLKAEDVKLYINGEFAEPGTYTRRNGVYTITADVVPEYKITPSGDCDRTGALKLDGNDLTCTMIFNFLGIGKPLPTGDDTIELPVDKVEPTSSETPTISLPTIPTGSPKVSPTASPSASPVLTASPSTTVTPVQIPTPSATVIGRPRNTPTPTPVPPPSGGGGGGGGIAGGGAVGSGGSLTGGGVVVSSTPTTTPTPITTQQTVLEDVRQVVETVSETTQIAIQVTSQVTTEVVTPVAAPTLTAVVSAPVAFTGLAAATASGSPAGFAFAQLGYFLEIIGLRRRRRVWGVIYNSKTKQPIPFAKIELRDQSNRTLETRYADKDGRYGFLASLSSLRQSSAQISLVPSSQEYAFPSKVVTAGSDFLVYDNIYHGGPIDVSGAELVGYNIPLDPQSDKVHESKSHPRLNGLMVRVLDAGFWVGLVAAPVNAFLSPSVFTIGILFTFIFANIFRISSDLYRPFGMVYNSQTGKPLPYALVTLNKPSGERTAFSVSDEQGRYFILAEPGSYRLNISTPANVQPPRTQSFLITSKKGWIRNQAEV